MLDFPAGFERTPTHEQTKNRSYQVSLRDAIRDLERELERLGVDDWRLSTDADHRKDKPNYPYAEARPDDPGAVVRWTMDGDQYAVACDAYTRLRDNVRTLGLYIREKRKMEGRPVVTGESEFANARLPSQENAGNGTGRKAPHEVLGVAPDAPESVIKGAARSLKAEHHPDAGGDQAVFKTVVKAEQALLSEDP